MSAFDRLVKTGHTQEGVESLPVWGLITDFTRVMDGDLTFQQLATKYELSANEQTEVGEYLTAIGSMVATRATALAPALGVEQATEVARAVVNSKMMHALLRAEQGTHTESTFRAVFGLD